MNQARKRTTMQKVLSMILVLVMLLSLMSMSAFTMATNETGASSSARNDFMRVFHLDCGRKYFSVAEIKSLIDTASAANYTHMELAVGNDSLRFLLDDMSVTVDGKTYASDDVKTQIHNGNVNYYDAGSANELSQSDMDAIIAYAQSKNISIIPLINTPGHMDAILGAATSLTGSDCAYNKSVRTIDLTNDTAVAFTQALLQKYINYFAGKGCGYFNMGADEYANDVLKPNGFSYLLSHGLYSNFVNYVNDVAKLIVDAGMTPIAFNDGIYYKNTTNCGAFSKDIVVSYWENSGTASASFIAQQGHKILNTNKSWYYVLGSRASWAGLETAKKGVQNTPVTSVQGDDGSVKPIGAMFCLWCDFPQNSYNETEVQNVKSLMTTLSNKNSTYFTTVTPQVETAHHDQGLTLGNSTILRLSTGLNAVWSVSDASVLSLGSVTRSAASTVTGNRVTVNALSRGTATVTAKVDDGQTYSMDLTVAGENDVRIDLTVGETWSTTVRGQDLSNQVGEFDDNIAELDVSCVKDSWKQVLQPVSGESYYIRNSDGKYLDANANWVSDYHNAVQWKWDFNQVLNNSLSYDGKHIYMSDDWQWVTSTKWNESISIKFDSDAGVFTYTPLSDKTKGTYTLGTPVNELEESPVDVSTVKITGKNVGATHVKIGGTWYNIVVNDNVPSNALTDDTIDLEYWITNTKTHATNDKNSAVKTTIQKAAAAAADGVEIRSFAPNATYNISKKSTTEVYYWQSMRLDKSVVQQEGGKSDRTADGTTLTHIRNHQGAWQYMTADGIWHYFRSGDQLVAYYLQKTTVTNELDTYVKDWGYGTANTTPNESGGNGQSALTVAVVYPGNAVFPAEGDMYKQSTTIFSYWPGRDIGIIAPENNSDYEVSKITVTDGKRDKNLKKDVWYSDDTITWEKKQLNTGGTWYDETVIWDKSSGTAPIINGKTSEITWPAKNTAKLILIYLEAKPKDTNLNVVYYDDNAQREISSYQIVMPYKYGDPFPKYTSALKGKNDEPIGNVNNWPGKNENEAGYLPDEAYVVNNVGKKMYFTKDIKTLNVAGNYKSGIYEYVSADISEDSKTLKLHFDLKKTNAKTYVVDFGLPVTIPVSAFGITNANTIAWMSLFESGDAMLENTGTYGTAKIDPANKTVTYTLSKPLDTTAAISLYVKFTGDSSEAAHVCHVNIIPATSVYYEDSFATFTDGTGKAAAAKWTKDTDGTAAKATTTQALTELGKMSPDAVYGYDAAYADSTKLSMGSAQMVTVKSDMYVKNDTTTTWPTATFTFKGTGFDVISLTNNKSGSISVKVYAVNSNGTETQVKGTLVNNYYGYELKDGAWTVNSNADTLYQIPVIKIGDLDYGTYKVVITAAYAPYADKTGKNQYSFWLDAIRVYDPMGKGNGDYAQDGEGYPQYIKLHDALVNSTAQSQAFFIDGAAAADITAYKKYGPNNEVYLDKGQAITFTVPGGDNIASIQIGAKAPDGKAAQMVVNKSEAKEIKSATEMYYEIDSADGSFTITNMGEGLLSLTNLKITFKEKPESTITLIPPTAEEQKAAVLSVRALFAEPEQTFAPEYFTAKWSRNVHKGGKATLTVKTSAEVEAIHVDDVTIDSYKVRTERSGWGSSAKKVTYHVFTYTVTATATADYTVCAINADGVMSDPITATLTVRPSIRDWWHNIFDKWQH